MLGTVWKFIEHDEIWGIGKSSLTNLNAKGDNAIGYTGASITSYSPAYVQLNSKLVYYISGGSFQEITNLHPDFKNATFFTLVEDENDTKILQKTSDDPQEALICEEAKLGVKVVDNEDKPIEDKTGIFWNLSSIPNGSTGAKLFEESNTTNAEGIAENYLTIGDRIGEYVVTSSCKDCTDGSPQTFTVKAKCLDDIPVYRQYNYKNETYDSSCKKYKKDANGNLTIVGSRLCNDDDLLEDRRTISQKGCALTSLAMALKKYDLGNLGDTRTVELLDTRLKNIGGYQGAGTMDWGAVERYLKDDVKLYYKHGELETKYLQKMVNRLK